MKKLLIFIFFLLLAKPIVAVSVGTTDSGLSEGKVVYTPSTLDTFNNDTANVNNSNFLDGYDSSEFWKTDETQSSLTGDKSGSFDLITTGVGTFNQVTVGFTEYNEGNINDLTSLSRSGNNDDIQLFESGDGNLLFLNSSSSGYRTIKGTDGSAGFKLGANYDSGEYFKFWLTSGEYDDYITFHYSDGIAVDVSTGDLMELHGDVGHVRWDVDGHEYHGADNLKEYFGAGNDGEIYFNGSDLIISSNYLSYPDTLTTYINALDMYAKNINISKAHLNGTDSTNYLTVQTGIDFDYVEKPPIVSLELINEVGNVDAGEHTYHVTYYTKMGETDAVYYNGAPDITTTAGSGKVNVTLPTSDDPRVIGRKLYRTKAGEAAYWERLLVDIPNNIDVEYIDNISDSSLGDRTYLYTRPNMASNMLLKDNVSTMVISSTTLAIGDNVGISGNGVTLGPYSGRQLEREALGNTFIGYYTGERITTGSSNTIIGYNAGADTHIDMDNSVLVGFNSGQYAQSSGNNVFVGSNSGRYQEGSYNVCVGSTSCFGNYLASAGVRNTAIGFQAGYELSDGGNYNQLIGMYAGNLITSGENNIIIGYNGDTATATQDYGIGLGRDVIANANEFTLGPYTTKFNLTQSNPTYYLGDGDIYKNGTQTYSGTCVNTTYYNGLAVGCND